MPVHDNKLNEALSSIRRPAICWQIGKDIAKIRHEMGLSQKDLADKMGVSQQIISRIEKGGENISLATLDNISRALGKKVRVSLI